MADESRGRNTPVRLTPKKQAALSRYLDISRRIPAPLPEDEYVPRGEFVSAMNLGLFGITSADKQRWLEELASHVAK